MTRVCLFTGSFNPPGLHHEAAAAALAARFDAVRVIPCGVRPDKPNTNAIPTVLRAALTDLAFRNRPRVVVDHFDLEHDSFTPSVELQRRFARLGELWHTVWADRIAGGRDGESVIQTTWKDGRRVWETFRFAVLVPPGVTPHPGDLAALGDRACVVPVGTPGASSEIRYRLFHGDPAAAELMSPRVREYVRRYELYTMAVPRTKALADVSGYRFKLVAGSQTDRADPRMRWLERLPQDPADPDAILVLGGDGTMLRAIHDNWHLRVPFVGLNFGHLGFLMNEANELVSAANGVLLPQLIVRRTPMLHVTFTRADGTTIPTVTFNDAWVERSTGQTAWLRVSLNGEVKLDKAVADGILVSSAAGSTAYASSMGAPPLLADTPAWLLVGSNVMRPSGWKSAMLPMDAAVRVESLDPVKRPLKGFVSGAEYADVVAMDARISRVASAELAFSPKHDMAQKISDLQFGAARSF